MFYFQLMGGIGNQMFQYAAARSLSLARSVPVRFFFLDSYPFAVRSFLLDKFALDIELIGEQEKNGIATLQSVMEKNYFVYDDQMLHAPIDSVMIGYWQNELYFKKYAAEIRRCFELKAPPSQRSRMIGKLIESKRCPVSVHIRRSDYAAHPEILSIHGLCTAEYYRKALQTLQEQLSGIHLFLFSDDVAWVKEHFDVQGLPCDIIEPATTDPQEDLILMTLCKHHIIANSSFSWWGAWLDPCPDKIVIAPRQWMTAHYDPPILCPDWIRL